MEDNQLLLPVRGHCMPRDLYIIIYIVTSYGQVVQLQLFNGQLGGKVYLTVFEGINVKSKTKNILILQKVFIKTILK